MDRPGTGAAPASPHARPRRRSLASGLDGRRAAHAVVLAGSLAFATACSDDAPTAPAVPVAIEISGDAEVPVGGERKLTARGRTSSGASTGPVAAQWASLDSEVATAGGAGRVAGLAPGSARIVATAAGLADTLTVQVVSADLALGQLRITLREGDATAVSTWEGFVEYRDVLDGEAGDLALLFGYAVHDGQTGDSTVAIRLPRGPAVGVAPIDAFRPVPGAGTGAVASMTLPGPGGGVRQLLGLEGGNLTMDQVALPARPGLLPGSIRGSAAFRAVTAAGGPGGDTIDVEIAFLLHLEHEIHPRVSLHLAGGPVAGEALRTRGASGRDAAGRLLVWWDADMDGAGGQAWPWELQMGFVLASPATTAYDLATITPDVHADPGRWPAAFSEAFYRDDARLALSEGGSLTVTRYQTPTAEYYGVIEGRLDAPLRLWAPDGTPEAGQAVADARFAIPLDPLGATPGIATSR